MTFSHHLDKAAVVTQVPGPKSLELLKEQDRTESEAVVYSKNTPIAIKRAQGALIEDMDGNVFIDFLTGAGVMCLGHGHPAVVQAAASQLQALSHALDFPTPVKQTFKESVLSILPPSMQENMRIHFCGPTGADAVEAAIKISRIHTGRHNILSFHGAYHGSTQMAMAITGNLAPKHDLPAAAQSVHFFPFPYCYRCPLGLDSSSCETNCYRYLEQTLKDSHSGITRPAAVIIEPVQGEGGSIPGDRKFFQELRRLTTELDIPLVVDEIQTGLGRTGTWFGFEHYGIEPDMIICSKALSGIGQPLALLIYNKKYKWKKGAHIGTFRGNQIAMAAGIETIAVMKREQVLENVRQSSAVTLSTLKEQLAHVAAVGDVRGFGLMIGIEIIDKESRQPCGGTAREIQQRCLSNGLLVELGGRSDSVVRLLPPLNISPELLREALSILCLAILQSTGSCQ